MRGLHLIWIVLPSLLLGAFLAWMLFQQLERVSGALEEALTVKVLPRHS